MRLGKEKISRESFAAFASQFPQNINKKKSVRAQFWLTVVSSREYTQFDIQPRVDQPNPWNLEQARREIQWWKVYFLLSRNPLICSKKLFFFYSFRSKNSNPFHSQRVDNNDNSVWNSIKDTFLILSPFACWRFWLNFLKDKKFRLCSSRSRSGEATIRSPEDVFWWYLLVDWKHSLRCELIPYLIKKKRKICVNKKYIWHGGEICAWLFCMYSLSRLAERLVSDSCPPTLLCCPLTIYLSRAKARRVGRDIWTHPRVPSAHFTLSLSIIVQDIREGSWRSGSERASVTRLENEKWWQ